MTGAQESRIKLGYEKAAKITNRYAGNFYFASLFLSKEKRNAVYSIYAICRLSDEATDKDKSLVELSTAKKNIEAVYAGEELNTSLLLAFKETVEKYSIPRHYFDKLIEGMYMDFCKNRYKNFDELQNYCHLVAGVIGLMVLKIFGYKDYRVEDYAVKLGTAMQLTNILRDIKEDYVRARIYLPQEEMSASGVSEEDIKTGVVNGNFKSLLKLQINRARELYGQSEPGFALITDARSRFVARLMKETYMGILDAIEANGYDVFSKRAFVSFPGKIIRLVRVLKRCKKDENKPC